jgi:glycosyltransferase involved in cell wall biosynthesis
MPKVLIVTYYWPPGSGAGVQRWLKFSKYLPQFGWEPVILTVDPDFATYPALDLSIENEIPPALTVIKTRATDYFRIYRKDKTKIPSSGFAATENRGFADKITRFIRGNFFIPDPRKGWNKYAFREACQIIGENKIDHIITTSPPHSTQLIGLKLKKRFPHIKWIADLRDPWTDIYYYRQFYPTLLSEKVDSWYELRVLKSADKILTVGKSLKELFASKVQGLEKKTEVIFNGFDEEDFTGITSSKPAVFTISYIGTLSDSYPVNGLLKAIASIKEKGTDLKLRFVGFVSEQQKKIILSVLEESDTEFVNYVDHLSAIKYMCSSSLLLLIIPDHPSNKSIITGKLFEYMAAGKPIICLGPLAGDAAGLLRSSGYKGIFSWNDTDAIADFILYSLNQGEPAVPVRNNRYSRKELTRELSKILNRQ